MPDANVGRALRTGTNPVDTGTITLEPGHRTITVAIDIHRLLYSNDPTVAIGAEIQINHGGRWKRLAIAQNWDQPEAGVADPHVTVDVEPEWIGLEVRGRLVQVDGRTRQSKPWITTGAVGVRLGVR